MGSNHDVSNLMRVLLDNLDDTCRILGDVLNLIEHSKKRLEPFANTDIAQNLTKQLLANLPPERVAALMKAMDELGKLIPADDSINAEEQVEKIRSLLDSLTKIRASFRFALDGVVQ